MLRKALIVVALVALAGSARAQTDHLKCYKIRDAAAKIRYTANLNGLAPENGCIIRVPGSLLCVAASKTGVSPAPPGGGPSGTDAGNFVCYKTKCPRTLVAGVAVIDQFGSRTVTPSQPRLLCAPASVGATSTTTNTTLTLPLTTTTGSLPLTTTTVSLPVTTTT